MKLIHLQPWQSFTPQPPHWMILREIFQKPTYFNIDWCYLPTTCHSNNLGCWKSNFEKKFKRFIYCHRTRWRHSPGKTSSTSLQIQSGLLYHRPGINESLLGIWRKKLWHSFHVNQLTVDSPNTRSFFSWLLCSIFPPPRHLHSIPKASISGLTVLKIWSVKNPKHTPGLTLCSTLFIELLKMNRRGRISCIKQSPTWIN